jgi:hypothetical protein
MTAFGGKADMTRVRRDPAARRASGTIAVLAELFGLDARELNHFGPLFDFIGDNLAEISR